MAIDRLPGGRFRARLMIDGQRYTATLPTEAEARRWEIETRGAVAKRRGVGSVTFAAYAEGWLAGFIDDAPDRPRFETELEDRLIPALGDLRNGVFDGRAPVQRLGTAVEPSRPGASGQPAGRRRSRAAVSSK